MVNSIGGARVIVVMATLAGVLVGPHANADDGSVPSPYGALVKGPFPATPSAEVSPLAQGLATRAVPAGVNGSTDPRTRSAATDAKQATNDAGPTSDVIFAAPTFPDARGRDGETFVKRQPSETADDVIFAAPTPSPPALKSDNGKSTPVAGATTSASGPSPSGPASTVAHGGDTPGPTPLDIAELKGQARERLTTGSIAAARALLDQAVAGGDAEAQYMLARTFDPNALAHDGAIGVAADPAKAAVLYRLARDGGYPVPDQEVRATRP